MGFQRNATGQLLTVLVIDADGLPVTDDAANLSAKVSKDGGTHTALGDTSATSVGDGAYTFDLAAGELDASRVHFTAATSTSGNAVLMVDGQQGETTRDPRGGAALLDKVTTLRPTRSVPTLANFPAAKIFGYWNAHTEESTTQLTDLSGNGRHMIFGATAPTFVTDPQGIRKIKFAPGVTDPITTTGNQQVVMDTSANYALIAIYSREGADGTLATNQLFGGSNEAGMCLRGLDDTDVQHNCRVGSTSYQAAPVVPRTHSYLTMSSASRLGTAVTHRVLSNNPNFQSDTIQSGYREVTGVAGDPTLTGDWQINGSLADLEVAAFAILELPTPREVEDFEGILYNLLMNPGDTGEPVINTVGDSFTSVSVAGRAPGYNELLKGNHLPADVFVQNYGVSGSRAGNQTGVPLEDRSPSVTFPRNAGRAVLTTFMYGFNDIHLSGDTATEAIDNVEAVAAAYAGWGAQPIWLGCAANHLGVADDVTYRAVTVRIRDRMLRRVNAFVGAIDTQYDDDTWGLGVEADDIDPRYMQDTLHPSDTGWADWTSLISGQFRGMLNLTAATDTTLEIAEAVRAEMDDNSTELAKLTPTLSVEAMIDGGDAKLGIKLLASDTIASYTVTTTNLSVVTADAVVSASPIGTPTLVIPTVGTAALLDVPFVSSITVTGASGKVYSTTFNHSPADQVLAAVASSGGAGGGTVTAEDVSRRLTWRFPEQGSAVLSSNEVEIGTLASGKSIKVQFDLEGVLDEDAVIASADTPDVTGPTLGTTEVHTSKRKLLVNVTAAATPGRYLVSQGFRATDEQDHTVKGWLVVT